MQSGLICLEVVAKLNQVSIDIRALVRESGLTEAEISPQELVRILKQQGFKSKLKTLDLRLLEKYPLPAIYICPDSSYGVLLKLNPQAQKLLVFSPAAKQSLELTYPELLAQSSGKVIVLKHKLFTSQVRFGFQWFYNEILHYKRVIGEVLLGPVNTIGFVLESCNEKHYRRAV
jgi:subfamily B ATP-binding cassette protein HlyB/CyaB